jgi:hypothetical protein
LFSRRHAARPDKNGSASASPGKAAGPTYLEAVIPVVHHPDYVAPARPGSRYQWNKNGLIRELLEKSGHAIDWIEPEPMPPAWIEAVHDPVYVAEVREARVPRKRSAGSAFRSTSGCRGAPCGCRAAPSPRL